MPKEKNKSVTTIKLEALAILLLLAAFLKVFLSIEIVVAIEAVLAIVFLFVLLKEAPSVFGKEFKQIGIFFGFFFLIIVANFLAQFLPTTDYGLRLNVFFAIAIIFVIFFVAFRFLFAKKIVSGRIVSSEKHFAMVEIDFDFLSMVNAGNYKIKTSKKFRVGEKVKLRTMQGVFGKIPIEIIE